MLQHQMVCGCRLPVGRAALSTQKLSLPLLQIGTRIGMASCRPLLWFMAACKSSWPGQGGCPACCMRFLARSQTLLIGLERFENQSQHALVRSHLQMKALKLLSSAKAIITKSHLQCKIIEAFEPQQLLMLLNVSMFAIIQRLCSKTRWRSEHVLSHRHMSVHLVSRCLQLDSSSSCPFHISNIGQRLLL